MSPSVSKGGPKSVLFQRSARFSVMNDLQPVKEYNLHHYKQQYNWDCGISCVIMVLPKKERHTLIKDLNNICKQEEFCKSTWTIDLCYLLRRFGVDHVFYTITLGIHPDHRQKQYYEKIISKDEDRVNRKFLEAKKKGVMVVKGSLSITELLQHLSKYGPIIILIDAIHLKCDICKLNRLSNELQKFLPRISSYHGHYIVLCGYNSETETVLYRNPGLGDRVCQTSYKLLDKARKSCGTDEDVILIYNS